MQGKLEHTETNIQKILALARSKDHCYGVNEYGFIAYIKIEQDESQLWALVNPLTHEIRNCGLNKTVQEYRVWQIKTGIKIEFNYNKYAVTYQLTMFQNFNAMRLYMMKYFQQTKDEDIGLLLSDLMLSSNFSDWRESPRTWDSAAWDDWMAGVHKTLKDLNITQDPKKILYNEQTAFLCMKNYLQIFYTQITFEGVKNILKIINAIKINSDTDEWNSWLSCIKAAIEQENDI